MKPKLVNIYKCHMCPTLLRRRESNSGPFGTLTDDATHLAIQVWHGCHYRYVGRIYFKPSEWHSITSVIVIGLIDWMLLCNTINAVCRYHQRLRTVCSGHYPGHFAHLVLEETKQLWPAQEEHFHIPACIHACSQKWVSVKSSFELVIKWYMF